MSEQFFTRELNFDEVVVRDHDDHCLDPSSVTHSGVQFRIPASAVEDILSIANYYAEMREKTSGLVAGKGAQVIDGGEVVGYIDGMPSYRFTTMPCFTKVESILIDGTPAGFEPDWTNVVIWDEGHGVTFICHGRDGFELAYGGSVLDFDAFLKECPQPAQSTPRLG